MVYADYEWFLEQDLSGYAGKWVAISNNKVIASAKDVQKVVESFKAKCPNKVPFIAKVRDKLSIL